MSFDGLMFRRIVTLLHDKIINCSINKVSQVSSNDFVFSLYGPTYKDKLIISTNNNASYMTLSSFRYDVTIPANHFMNVMHRHIENGVIIDIKQMGLDRIVCFTIRQRDELGDYSIKKLYVELTGKLTNMIITKEDNIIIDCMHRLGVITDRTIMSGAKYRVPNASSLKDPLTSEYDINSDLCGQFFGFSKNLEKEVRYRIEQNEALKDIISEILNSNKIYTYKNDYHLIPFKSIKEEPIISEWDKGILDYYREYQKKMQHDESIKELLNIAKKEAKKYSSKISKLEEELQKAENSENYLKYGDLIYTYVTDLDSKQDSIEIIDNDTKITIPLDSKISIKDNAQKFYKKYQKLRNSKNMIQEQIDIAKNEYEYFELLKIQINDADKIELEQIKNELAEAKYIKIIKKGPKKKQEKFMPHTYTSPSGIKVSVGMNNYQNEYLTHKLAKYNEYFFHVKDYAGSHVIVHSTEPLTEETIRYAANLAAYYSKARLSSSVPVDYTLVKNVKKHPSNRIGLVLLKNYKTIYIDATKPSEN